MYLKIENPGVAPAEAFTLMGASTKRHSENNNLIGKFGTGNKQAIGTLMRAGLNPIIFCGNLRLTFSTRTQNVDSGLGSHDFQRIVVTYSGKDAKGVSRTGTEDLGWVLEHGAIDWQTTDLALREFVSNSLDRAMEEGEHNFKKQLEQDQDLSWLQRRDKLNEYLSTATDYKNVNIEVFSDEKRVRANAGTTRVFIPVNEDVFKFYSNLGKWFLHFSEPEMLKETILPKNGRNLGANQTAVIYRRGVRVREVETSKHESLFDYNLEDLELDEARKVDDWRVQYEAARCFRNITEEKMITFWQSCLNQREVWEHGFYGSTMAGGNSDVWRSSFYKAAGQDAVIATRDTGEYAARKGFKVVTVPENFLLAATSYRVPSAQTVLTKDEQEGREVFDADAGALDAVDWVWSMLVSRGMTNGKAKPEVKTFRRIMDAGGQTLGYYRSGVVYLNQDITGGRSVQLLVTALEEVVHHVTGATDNSRDFQDYLLNFIVQSSMNTEALA